MARLTEIHRQHSPELWHQQSEDFEANFPLKGKSDFRSMRDVRSYAPKQAVLWSRCSHVEFCVMQVYRDGTTPVVASGTAHMHG
jgi:hypothetical protein